MQQLGIGYGAIALSTYFALIAVMIVSLDDWVWFPFWLGLGLLFMIERVVTVWRSGWQARLLALTLFPELFFAVFLNVVFVKGIFDIAFKRKASWHYLPQGAPRSTPERW